MNAPSCKYIWPRPTGKWAWRPTETQSGTCASGVCACALVREDKAATTRSRSLPVSQQWRVRLCCRLGWGCCLCLRHSRFSESAPAANSEHTQVPGRAAGGRLGLPGRSLRCADGCPPLPLQGTAPRSALGPPNPGGDWRPRSSVSGPGRYRGGRCTLQASWPLCYTSVCRCGTAVSGMPLVRIPHGGATVPLADCLKHTVVPWLPHSLFLFFPLVVLGVELRP